MIDKKVSVVIPTYNCGQYISKAIESVLNQTYQNFEIIVIDDGSTDNTKSVLIPYMDKIKYIYKKNGGPSGARNLGINNAKGEYIAFLDADDLLLEEYLSKCVNYIEKNRYDLVWTDSYADIYNENGIFICRKSGEREDYPSNKDYLYEKLFKRFQNGFSGTYRIVIKKDCFNKIGYFDENLIIIEDWDLWLRIAKNKLNIGYIQEYLSIYRRHGKSLCRSKNNERTKLHNIYKVFEKNKKDAFGMGKSLIKIYSETLWMLGAESITKKIDFLFGIKCLLKSQICCFRISKILNPLGKYFKKQLKIL